MPAMEREAFIIFILGDILCLHQIGNHEPVEFGEFGIDPVERDQVLTSIELSKIIAIL